MATSERNQSNHVTNRQRDFGQPMFMEGIRTWFKLKTSANLLKLLEKEKEISSPNLVKKMFH